MSSFSKQIWVVPPLNPSTVFSDPPPLGFSVMTDPPKKILRPPPPPPRQAINNDRSLKRLWMPAEKVLYKLFLLSLLLLLLCDVWIYSFVTPASWVMFTIIPSRGKSTTPSCVIQQKQGSPAVWASLTYAQCYFWPSIKNCHYYYYWSVPFLIFATNVQWNTWKSSWVMTKTLATLYINTDPLQGKPEITVGKSVNYGSCHLRPMFSPLIGRSTLFPL